MNLRMKNLIGFLLCVGLIAAALLLQETKHLNPCPLCILQRVAFIGIGIVFLIFTLLPVKTWLIKIQGLLLFLVSGSGLAVAIRQIYLQHLPADKVPACGPGLNYLVQNFPLHQVTSMVFQGSGECARIDWQFLGLSMAEWSAIWLCLFLIYGIKLLWSKNRVL